ncbi:hypothetical protein [Tessaracoccus sp. G1721]
MNTRPNVVLAVVAGLVVLLAIVAGVMATNREPPEMDPGTPDGTAQLLALAVIDGDDEEAVSYLDPALGCTVPLPEVYRPTRMSMSVVDTKVDGDRATVVLNVTESSGGLFSSYDHREVIELKADGDGWMATGHPWPIYSCK